MRRYFLILLLIGCLAFTSGCLQANPQEVSPVPAILTLPVVTSTLESIPVTSTSTALPTSTSSPTAANTSSPTATIDPYGQWTIEWLRDRQYGGGILQIEQELADNSYFTRYLVSYPSDELQIFGFMDVPQGDGPFPVVIAIHGYIDPGVYNTLDYTTGYADDLARRGYLVIHPNLRDYPPSDSGENRYRVGMAIDILNLVAIVKSSGGTPGSLEKANSHKIGLWGHSMGGGIATRVMTVNHQDVQAVFLYAPMSGDEQQNFEGIYGWSNNQRGIEELNTPPTALERISPMYFYDDITARVSLNHGLADELVPVQWSQKTCDQLIQAGVDVDCTFYPGMPHTFYGDGELELMNAAVNFFNETLISQK
jgi:dienelactone hydrolase